MSTRGAYGFRINGIDKIAYCHFDSYPMGWAVGLLEMIQKYTNDELKTIAEGIQLVTNDVPPTKEQIAECEKYTNLHVSNGSTDDWYCLLRETQGNLEVHKDIPYMLDASDSLKDSLHCEYAYILNLDEKVFEVYIGGNKDASAAGRYANFLKRRLYRPENSQFYGVALFKTITFDQIRAIYAEDLDTYMIDLAKEIDAWIDKIYGLAQL